MSKCKTGFKTKIKTVLVLALVMGMILPKMPIQAATNMIKFTGDYDETNYPQKNIESVFTDSEIVVDGIKDEAYSLCTPSEISNYRAGKYGYAYASENDKPHGEISTIWDGPVLYAYVTVYDKTPYRSVEKSGNTQQRIIYGEQETTTGNTVVSGTGNKTYSVICDSVTFGIDLYNDKLVNEADTIGMFTITAANDMIYFANSNIPSLSSVMGDPNHPCYQNRIKSYAAKDILYTVEKIDPETGETTQETKVIGYSVEVAIQLEGLELNNGTALGLEVGINDVAHLKNNGDTSDTGNLKRVAQTFWSHSQDSLYTEFDHERPNAVDWGNLTLCGWDGETGFAYSDWRITNTIRYLDSIAFQKGVYTAETQAELDAARQAAEDLLASGTHDVAATDDVADRLVAAVAGLRWADTRYPDPADLPVQCTLPNTYQFFGSEKKVETLDEWEERRQEILNLAQFYEYGFKPDAADSLQIKSLTVLEVGDVYRELNPWYPWFGSQYNESTATSPMINLTYTLTVGEKSGDVDITVYLPTDEQLEAVGRSDEKIPLVLSYDGDNAAYRDAGYGVVTLSSGSSGDVRSNDYAWGTRSGLFYTLFPYSRNGQEALNEVSSEMAAAWTCSSTIDALFSLADSEIEGAADAYDKLDLEKLAVTGFSINGKYAFVSAVFDERIGVCIPGAAGATGPSPWRYVYIGQEYDWTDTMFAPDDISYANQISTGTEIMYNSYLHNRVRQNTLFSHFMTPGHYRMMEDGAYGYGTRLPFDQHDLVASLAPRAIVLENTTNDYNDGCVADCLGLEIAKSVYNGLGYDGDSLVKFNLRKVYTSGDPHGSDSAQHTRSAEYLNEYFYGVQMSESTAQYLNTDPFSLSVSNGKTQSPYDYYYGGYNTITGGVAGTEGTDGWYYYTLPKEMDTPEPTPIVAPGISPVWIVAPTWEVTKTDEQTADTQIEETEVEVPEEMIPEGTEEKSVVLGIEKIVNAEKNKVVKKSIKALFAKDSELDAIVVVTKDMNADDDLAALSIKVSKLANIAVGDTVHVYKYNSETGKYEELLNGTCIVEKGKKINLLVAEGGLYVVSNKPLDASAISTLKSRIAENITISGKNKATLYLDGKAQKKIKAVLPENIIDVADNDELAITYKSNNKDIATVTKKGTVNAKAKGTTKIKVTVKLGKKTISTKNINITVK